MDSIINKISGRQIKIIQILITIAVAIGSVFGFYYVNIYKHSISSAYVNLKTIVDYNKTEGKFGIINIELHIDNESEYPLKIQTAWINIHGEKICPHDNAKFTKDKILSFFKKGKRVDVNKYYKITDAELIYTGTFEDDKTWTLEPGEKVYFNKLVPIPKNYTFALIQSEIYFTDQGTEITFDWNETDNLIHPVFSSSQGLFYKVENLKIILNDKY